MINNFEDTCDLIFKSVKEILKQKALLNKDIEKYLIELKRFVSIRKKDPWINVDSVKSMTFNYDFESISHDKFFINPQSISLLNKPARFNFFHDQEQQKYITNQVKIPEYFYKATARNIDLST